jgi:hypothetical protein
MPVLRCYLTPRVLAFLLLFLPPYPALQSQQQTVTFIQQAPVYPEPHTRREPLLIAAAQSTADLEEIRGDWLMISFEDSQGRGRFGFVQARFARVNGPAPRVQAPQRQTRSDPDPPKDGIDPATSRAAQVAPQGLTLSGPPSVPSAGIRLLTSETFAQAVTDADRCAPIEEILNGTRTPGTEAYGAELRKRFPDSPPRPSIPNDCFSFYNHTTFAVALVGGRFYTYSIRILSPYLRVATDASEAKRKFSTLTLTMEKANEGLVTVLVVPDGTRSPSIIEDAAIRRGDRVIRPVRKIISPTTLQNGFGATFRSSEAVFTFPIDGFQPTESIELAVIAAEATATTKLTPEKLATLK